MSFLQPQLYAPSLRLRLRGPVYQSVRNAAGVSNVRQKKQYGENEGKMSMDDQLEVLDVLNRRGWPEEWDRHNSPVLLLDHYLPVPASRLGEGNLLKGLWQTTRLSLSNRFQNVFNLSMLARHRPFLGIPNLSNPKSRWSLGVLGTMSTGPNAWIAPLRKHSLDIYTHLNEAQASGDLKAIGTLARGRMEEEVRQRIRDLPKNQMMVWKLHGEASPTQCLSIRTIDDDNMSSSSTKRKAKLLVTQVLMKFDTHQSLMIYDKKTGRLLASKGTPEAPTRIVEYMVLEKRMQMDGRWYIRDQLYPGTSVKRTALNSF
ncbi:hypothetical protein FRB98_003930 [Tulasnella sp. 332]|nr:hypothetical protein FRB98_003930 [Tulasnella sp. 332]